MVDLKSRTGWWNFWAAVVVWLWACPLQATESITVWHAYRGAEESALKKLADRWNQSRPEHPVVLLSIPYDAFSNKLTSAIPRGHGPDVFLAAHERAGDWARANLIEVWQEDGIDAPLYHPTTVDAVRVDSGLAGVPLAYKSLVLFYNPTLIEAPPSTTDELIALARAHTDASSSATQSDCESVP